MMESRHSGGVTLIEMLVVLGVILVLAGVVVTVTLRVESQGKEAVVQNAFTLLGSALHEYHEARGQFPPQTERNTANARPHAELMYRELHAEPASRQVLEKLNTSLIKNTSGPADLRFICDPWGTTIDYVYATNDTFPRLTSAGSDRKFGTDDDLVNTGR
ncbi:MAG: prepilin-type N-terminal cleavage/methylation domain-containing protein [Planctomycetes bacterium]|jgi:prepilin-type N-terminal cleavage/methylation domain-containing protein|nr:prepilin-type N-terminal cleavage/methylation domain-containing protein [Planctomycetota bacterium]